MIASRTFAPELRGRYEAEGWWTSDTLGSLLGRALEEAPATTFRVHSTVRPYSGTFSDAYRDTIGAVGGGSACPRGWTR